MLNQADANLPIILKNLPQIIKSALQEDCAFDDITSDLTIEQNAKCSFQINAREELIFCGNMVIKEVIEQLKLSSKFYNASINIELLCDDGAKVLKGSNIAIGSGDAKLVLVAERTILNLVQHLSSIATNVNKYVSSLNNPKIKILDTRKTLPNLRELQKYAVRCGGGFNHRFNLAEMILIKDNHIQACGGVAYALERVRKINHNLKIEIECDNIEQVRIASKHCPDIIMLDNMQMPELQQAIKEIRDSNPDIMIEISGGVNLANIHQYRELDINFISIGALTTSVKAVDIGLDFL